MSRFSEVIVTNEANERIGRGGKTFKPHEKRAVMVTDAQFKEIKACAFLLVEKVNKKEDKEFTCPICKIYICTDKKDLKKHVREKHPDEYDKMKNRR